MSVQSRPACIRMQNGYFFEPWRLKGKLPLIQAQRAQDVLPGAEAPTLLFLRMGEFHL